MFYTPVQQGFATAMWVEQRIDPTQLILLFSASDGFFLRVYPKLNKPMYPLYRNMRWLNPNY